MTLVSPTPFVDGTVHTAAQHNDPIDEIADAINGGLSNENIASGAAIATAKLASDAGITGAMLGPAAIKLGYAQATATQAGITAEVDVTSLSSAVTVPAGGRDVKITVHFAEIGTSANSQRASIAIKESTTVLGRLYKWLPSTSGGNGCEFSARVSAPSAGAHTYKVTIARDVGAGTIDAYASATEPSFILVEMI